MGACQGKGPDDVVGDEEVRVTVDGFVEEADDEDMADFNPDATLCKHACGKPVQPGETKRGNKFDTCCRMCAMNKGSGFHDPTCGGNTSAAPVSARKKACKAGSKCRNRTAAHLEAGNKMDSLHIPCAQAAAWRAMGKKKAPKEEPREEPLVRLMQHGKLTKPFKQCLVEIFSRFDSNGDKILDKEELQAFSRAANVDGREFKGDEFEHMKAEFDWAEHEEDETGAFGGLTLRGFVEMFTQQTRVSEAESWSDLDRLGYDRDLKRRQEMSPEMVELLNGFYQSSEQDLALDVSAEEAQEIEALTTSLGLECRVLQSNGSEQLHVFKPPAPVEEMEPGDDVEEGRSGDCVFSALELEVESSQLLLDTFKDSIPEGWVVYAHHMTICLGSLEDANSNGSALPDERRAAIRTLRPKDLRMLRVVSIGKGSGVLAVGVVGCPSVNRVPHITLACAKNHRPVESNSISSWAPLPRKRRDRGDGGDGGGGLGPVLRGVVRQFSQRATARPLTAQVERRDLKERLRDLEVQVLAARAIRLQQLEVAQAPEVLQQAIEERRRELAALTDAATCAAAEVGADAESSGWEAAKDYAIACSMSKDVQPEPLTLRVIFDWSDSDGSGKLSRGELEASLGKIRACCGSLPEVTDEAWHHLDEDGNGVVNFGEFAAWAGPRLGLELGVAKMLGKSASLMLAASPCSVLGCPCEKFCGKEDEASDKKCKECKHKKGLHVAKVTTGEVPFPPYWNHHDGEFNELVPMTGKSVNEEFQKLLDKTYRKAYTKDRAKHNPTNPKVPKGFEVLAVKRNENKHSWQEYAFRRGDILSRDSLPEIFADVKTSMAMDEIGGDKANRLHSECNEWYLFHGTNPEAAAAICASDFKVSRAGSSTGTLYGKGLYFAESVTKAPVATYSFAARGSLPHVLRASLRRRNGVGAYRQVWLEMQFARARFSWRFSGFVLISTASFTTFS
ncbi:unnamed protein product [Effrenium voratum]|nr:unnamed protein product [Effrenium voratum]